MEMVVRTLTLNESDKYKLKQQLTECIAGYLVLGIVVQIIMLAVLAAIMSLEASPFNTFFTAGILFSLSILGFLVFLLWMVRPYLRDLRNDTKLVLEEKITDKKTETNWGWHGNPAADATSQPKITSHTLYFETFSLSVSEDTFKLFKAGEKVCISFAAKSNAFLGIEKA